MAYGKIPGPLCQYQSPVEIADGTMCLQPSPAPGPIGVSSALAITDVSRMSRAEKLKAAILRARYYLSPEVGEKLLALVSPQAIKIILGTAAVWGAGHFLGVSEVVDVILIGLGALALGKEALTAAKDLTSFVSGALNARSFSDLDRAGQHLARFVATVGVDAAIAVLLHKIVGRKGSAKSSVAEEPMLRPDVSLSGAGRSGQNVKFLTGPPNSAVRSVAPGRVFVTDSHGQVILDITAERVKPVTPKTGFGEKRPPTPEELDLIRELWGE